jgi:uncharacterized damage-inducible protein DinB
MELVEQIIDSWNIHNRINLYVLEAVSVEALSGVSASKGRNVGEMIAHIHNVRLMWLKAARPELLEGLVKIEKEQAQDKSCSANLWKSRERHWRHFCKKG